jgi:NIMA (never in mitosis gene a)-related kinase
MLADYEIIRILGKGTFGKVYLAKCRVDRKIWVLKIVSLVGLSDEEKEIALNESKLISQISHRNIIRYYESFIEKDNLVIVTEYAEGGDLHQKIESQFGYEMEICHR